MDREFFNTARIAFVIEGCIHCNSLKSFIERFNLKLPLDNRIKLVDCSRYYDFGIIDDPLILAFKDVKNRNGIKVLDGSFPKVVFDGHVLDNGAEKDIIQTFLKTLLINEFVTQEYNPFIFSKDCEKINKGIWKDKIQCQ